MTSLVLVLSLCGWAQSTPLFEQDKTGWKTIGDVHWHFEKGELVGIANDAAGYVTTSKAYSNFELTLEFKPDSSVNSGIFLRCSSDVVDPFDCFEVNIWDLHPNRLYKTGAVVTREKPKNTIETIGKWNSARIRLLDNRLQVWFNGILLADYLDEEQVLLNGYIALQAAESGMVRFRNISIVELN